MSDHTHASEISATGITINDDLPAPPNLDSKSLIAIRSLSTILPSIPPSLETSSDPARTLLCDSNIYVAIAARLGRPNSGAGDDDICRWLYDAFNSGDPGLHLVVLSYIPLVAGAYLSRAAMHRPLPGFEAVLLALYSHETSSRAGQPITIVIPDVSHPSIYHKSTVQAKNHDTSLNLAVVSPTLEPYGTVRSTRRARIVGVALELYYGKIHLMPKYSKLDFCHVCGDWAGKNEYKNGRSDGSRGGDSDGDDEGGRGRNIPLPWELLQPIVRILGHCIVGYWANDVEVSDAAKEACRSLHVRAIHDINSKAILATESLPRLGNLSLESTEVKVKMIKSM